MIIYVLMTINKNTIIIIIKMVNYTIIILQTLIQVPNKKKKKKIQVKRFV